MALSVVGASAQTTVAGSKFTDNWSFTLKGWRRNVVEIGSRQWLLG